MIMRMKQKMNWETEHSILGEHDNNMNNQELLDILNRIITVDEVEKVILKLKNEKAGGIDKIIPELIKAIDDSVIDVITLILNKIFDSGDFPEEWALGIIVILFKDGTKSDLNNYRGITLLSMLGKILVGVLHNRLWEVVDKFEILRENQAGFRHGYRTTDHIFTLSTVINHYVIKTKDHCFYALLISRKHLIKLTINCFGKTSIAMELVEIFLISLNLCILK